MTSKSFARFTFLPAQHQRPDCKLETANLSVFLSLHSTIFSQELLKNKISQYLILQILAEIDSCNHHHSQNSLNPLNSLLLHFVHKPSFLLWLLTTAVSQFCLFLKWAEQKNCILVKYSLSLLMSCVRTLVLHHKDFLLDFT